LPEFKDELIVFGGELSGLGDEIIMLGEELSGSKDEMNNRRASPAVSLTFMLYSDKETAQAVSLHVFFGSLLGFAPGS
jgi:hypothetical protein